MSDKIDVAVKSLKGAQAEMVQWENRVEAEKQNYANLKRQSEILQAEIDQKRTEYSNYISTHEKQVRDGLDAVREGQKMLDAQRNEFKAILQEHEREKGNLAQEKIEFLKERSRTDGRRQLVEEFIQAVRRAYNVLPDK